MQALAMAVGLLCNLLLALVKLYVGISSNSLAVYCDAVNNFGDALLCTAVLIAVLFLCAQSGQIRRRAESLLTFCIGLVLFVAGAYFFYSGVDRILYPLPIAYLKKYAVLLACTVPVKVFFGGAVLLRRQKTAGKAVSGFVYGLPFGLRGNAVFPRGIVAVLQTAVCGGRRVCRCYRRGGCGDGRQNDCKRSKIFSF